MKDFSKPCLALFAVLLLSACGGDSRSYTVGGTVSGLSEGQSLKLHLNNQTLSISADGDFRFPDEVTHGSSYAVTGDVPAAGLACTMTGGSGKAKDDVSDIAITCQSGSVVSTLAGTGQPGFDDAAGQVKFSEPTDVAVDGYGHVYVADSLNHRIRKITPAGAVGTLAGSGVPGNDDGAGVAATFNTPSGVALDASGNVYVADRANHRIRTITPAGAVGRLQQIFNFPVNLALDAVTGAVYVTDFAEHLIYQITAGFQAFAGSASSSGYVNATGLAARFNVPAGITVDGEGFVYVADRNNHRIRKIALDRAVTLLAGSGTPDHVDGTGEAAGFNSPYGVAVDAHGNVYVSDLNHVIRKITPAGAVSTLAGMPGIGGFRDGDGVQAQFNAPAGLAVDARGHVYVADKLNYRIRKITGSFAGL